MQIGDTIIRDQQAAVNYDEQARITHWFGHEIVFGLVYEFVEPGDSLLKSLEFPAFKYPAENRDVFFTAYVTRRIEPNQ